MKTLFLFLLLLSSYSASAQANWQWVNQLTSSGAAVSARSITTDAAGNSYVTGSFAGRAIFGSTTLISRGQTDIFLVKYNPGGRAMWAVQLGGDPAVGNAYYPPSANSNDVALDGAGNVYLVGNFTGNLAYGNGRTLPSFSEGFQTAFIAKVNARGQVQWAKRFGIGQYSCYAYALATDAAGNSYVTGQSDYGQIQFDNIVTTGSRRVMFVARYTTSGTVAWAKSSTNFSSFGASGNDIALDKRGNCYVGGFFNNDMTLDGTALTTVGADSYLARFVAASGSLQWLKKGGGSGTPNANNNVHISTLDTDRQGNIYVAGDFSGTTSVGGQPLAGTGPEQPDIFLARYSPVGTVQWAKTTGTSTTEYSTQLVTDADGYCTLVGRRLNASYEPQLLLHSFQPNGDLYYSDVIGTSGSCTGTSVAQDANGLLYVTGNLSGTASFGSTTLQTATRTDGFVGRLRIRVPQSGNNGGGKPTVEVFPNPVRGRLVTSLTWDKAGLLVTGKALLTNAMGCPVAARPLLATSATQSQAVFDCSALPTGLYVLYLATANGTFYTRGVEVR
ncbi:SBBP repeat-containing protein [Hymenobacter perfusus]|nr:SBBP repeat-containing protein [Hymenobacter perfusus]